MHCMTGTRSECNAVIYKLGSGFNATEQFKHKTVLFMSMYKLGLNLNFVSQICKYKILVYQLSWSCFDVRLRAHCSVFQCLVIMTRRSQLQE